MTSPVAVNSASLVGRLRAFAWRYAPVLLLIVFAISTTFGVKWYRDVQSKKWRYPHESAHLKLFFEADPDNVDSWYPMSMAYAHVLVLGGDNLYDDLVFTRGLKYQYPPSALLFFRLIEVFDPEPVAPQRQKLPLTGGLIRGWLPELERLMWWSTAVEMAGTVLLLLLGLKRAATISGRGFGPQDVVLAGACGLVGVFYCFGITRSFTIGQIQPLIGGLVTLALLAWWWRRGETAGALLGLVALIKPQLGIVLIWALIRRQWNFAAGFLITAGGGTLLALKLYGLEAHLDYVRVLSFIGRHGESFFANVSFNGLLHRALQNGPILEWTSNSFAPYHPVVYYGTLITSIGLLVLVLWPSRLDPTAPDAPIRSTVDLGSAIFGATLASPVAWGHHYNVLPPMLAVAFAGLMLHRERIPWVPVVLLGLGSILISKYFEIVHSLANTPWNFLMSYALFGGLMALYVATYVRRAPLAPAMASSQPTPVASDPTPPSAAPTA